MKNDELTSLIETIRKIVLTDGVEEVKLERLRKNPAIQNDKLDKYFENDKKLAESIFENDKNHFEVIFQEKNFETNNAIDNLFTVSEVIAKNFNYLSPSIYHYYQEKYPDIYQSYFDKRSDLVFEKIKINLNRGIWQGYYRDDLGIELVARGYIKRLIDLYNKENFPADNFSFDDFFNQMVETFVLSIATEKGRAYWEKKKAKTGLIVKNDKR
jgi:hypothetical protein